MCEYCRDGIGTGKSILHDDEYSLVNIFIVNGSNVWKKGK